MFLQTAGVTLVLFGYHELADDAGPGQDVPRSKLPGITLARNVREHSTQPADRQGSHPRGHLFDHEISAVVLTVDVSVSAAPGQVTSRAWYVHTIPGHSGRYVTPGAGTGGRCPRC